ncbi:hypothetical protein [Treponema sp.]|uniref:hypothetical protein n=1 Tax=Treponema sp. TaxID=166 RepID=UPI00298E9B50|nr:hypothetical protein [Treponema sp.]MCQ2242489.1 hypothetical protein [Treponema sp.]
MTQQDTLVLRGLELKMDRILDFFLKQQKKENVKSRMEPATSEWITLRQACDMHGGYKLSTLRARLDLQPMCGRATMIGNNKCWRRSEIEEWLAISSAEERKAYQRKYNGEVKL